MIPKPCGISSAANSALDQAAAISVPVVGASPHRTERGGEAGDADQEQPPAAVDVAEPARR